MGAAVWKVVCDAFLLVPLFPPSFRNSVPKLDGSEVPLAVNVGVTFPFDDCGVPK